MKVIVVAEWHIQQRRVEEIGKVLVSRIQNQINVKSGHGELAEAGIGRHRGADRGCAGAASQDDVVEVMLSRASGAHPITNRGARRNPGDGQVIEVMRLVAQE